VSVYRINDGYFLSSFRNLPDAAACTQTSNLSNKMKKLLKESGRWFIHSNLTLYIMRRGQECGGEGRKLTLI